MGTCASDRRKNPKQWEMISGSLITFGICQRGEGKEEEPKGNLGKNNLQVEPTSVVLRVGKCPSRKWDLIPLTPPNEHLTWRRDCWLSSLTATGIQRDGAANTLVACAWKLWGMEGCPSLPVYPRRPSTPCLGFTLTLI